MTKVGTVDHVQTGFVVAFDADTGQVLHIHEKIVETVDGKPACTTEITPQECEEIRQDIAGLHRGTKVDALIAPPEIAAPVGMAHHVDPFTRTLQLTAEDE